MAPIILGVSFMSTTNQHSILFQFAFFPNYEESIRFLAESLTDKEEWDFSDSQEKKYSILKNYLDHTFLRLQQEKKIVYTINNKFACFNTGLVTTNMEDIFAFFEVYNNPKPGVTYQYCFKSFSKKSDNQIIKHFSGNFPEIANYFDKPELLIFNPKCELIPDMDHIIGDNKSRFPLHLQNVDDAELRRQLNGAIEEVKKKIKTNYTIAVPQYFGSKIQLLLPLCLTSGSPNPDLALVAQKEDENTYSARTCLTLRMAYNNARLIVKPQSNWLKP
jgi:hypothetical protein